MIALLRRRRLLLLGLAVALWLPLWLPVPVAYGQQAAQPQDVVILLDTSASMVGQGTDPKAQDIWSKVLSNLADLVGTLPASTRVMVLPFDQGVHTDEAHTFATRPARQELLTYLATIKPTGQSTWIYESVVSAYQQLTTWSQGQPQRTQALYVYTDGLDNGAHSATWVDDLSRTVRLQRSAHPYLYTFYNDLQSQLTAPQVQTLQASGVPVVQGFAQINTPVLDFGLFAAGQTSKTATLPFFFTSDVPASAIALKLNAANLPIHIEPTQAQIGSKTPNIPVTLYLDGAVPGGVHQEASVDVTSTSGLNIQGTHTVALRFQIAASPTATPKPTATATATALPTATSTPHPTPTPAATATPVPPPSPPAPPDLTVALSPTGSTIPLDTPGLHFGLPTTITQPGTLRVSVGLIRPGDASNKVLPYTTWFAANSPPTFRLIVDPTPANAKRCAATGWCAGVAFPALAGATTTQTITPARLIADGQQLSVRVVGDGILADGQAWHREYTSPQVQAHRYNWVNLWDGLGIGYWGWLVVIGGLAALVSVVDTRLGHPF